jgi:VWFA-related protein
MPFARVVRPGPWCVVLTLLITSTPKGQSPGTTPLRQGDKIRVGVDLVTTPVIVRDRRGQFLPDVKLEEFEVYEDAVRQTVVTFSLTHGGRMLNVAAPPQPPGLEGILLPASRPTPDASGRVFLILIDDLHLDAANTPRIRELCRSIAKEVIHDGDLFGVLSTGHSSIAIDLTYDRRRLDEAIARIMGGGLTPREILDVPLGAEGPPEVRHRAHVAFRTAYDLVTGLEKIHGRRKAVIYVSNGYDLNPFSEARAKLDAERPGGSEQNPFAGQERLSDSDLVSQLSELIRAANRANATFYTIDPRGLDAGPDLSQPINMVEWQKHVARSQAPLQVLAAETGWIAVINSNSLSARSKRSTRRPATITFLGTTRRIPTRRSAVER